MALKLLANNNAKSVLAAGISASATVITVGSGTGRLFPQPVSGQSYFKLTIVDAATKSVTEIVHVTSISGDVMTVQRAQEGTLGRVWSTNDIVANMMTAGTLDLLAPIDSPVFTGDPKAPTPAVGDNDTSIATTAFVKRAIGNATGRLQRIIVMESSGVYTPATDINAIEVIVTGAGGSGGGCAGNSTSQTISGAGGGGGGTAIKYMPVTAGTEYPVVIGVGGASVSGATGGNSGGNTTFNGNIIGYAGGFGAYNAITSTSGGVGGLASGGDVNISGGAGSDGQSGPFLMAGNGGGTFWGSGGRAGSGGGLQGYAYGSGGGGAYDGALTGTAYPSGAGKNGVVVIKEYS